MATTTDITSTEDAFRNISPDEVKSLEVELVVGNLRVVGAGFQTSVWVNDKKVACRSLDLHLAVGELPSVRLEYFPTVNNKE